MTEISRWKEPIDYDAGLLNDFGGGNVDWWQDYLRAEIGRANDFWRDQLPPDYWQDIGTCPKDGTRFLLKTLDGKISIGWQKREGGAIFAVENLGNELSKPAFWKPI